MKKIDKLLILLTICGFFYLVGALTVYNKWKIYRIASYYKQIIINLNPDEKLSIDNYFVNELITSDKLIHKKITSRNQLKLNLDRLQIPDDIDSIYPKIRILSVKKQNRILRINYRIGEYRDSLFAYHKTKKGEKPNNGILIIPGSGINQSSKIFYNDNISDNYQSNIDDILDDFGDRYIYIKPNEDILAIHNGKRKINEDVFVNYLLNKGASYSKYYLVQTFVLERFLKQNYETVTVAGLSQGGLAAMINSLKTEPDFAIISSGYSVLMDNPYLSNHRQIIIPGFKKNFNSDYINLILKKQKTKYLFTYGKLESGIYGTETVQKNSEKLLELNRNLTFNYHDGGHIYPEKEILDFCKLNKINY